jgi:hypothetical protein
MIKRVGVDQDALQYRASSVATALTFRLFAKEL